VTDANRPTRLRFVEIKGDEAECGLGGIRAKNEMKYLTLLQSTRRQYPGTRCEKSPARTRTPLYPIIPFSAFSSVNADFLGPPNHPARGT
jgi:hypothetical protein